MKAKRVTRRIAIGLSCFLTLMVVLGALVMLLWNALVPELFDGPMLSYWQAVGVLLLSHILLRGTPFYGIRARRNARRRRCLREKLAAMTSAERAAVNDELGIPTDGTGRTS
jgi:hypothetical protein